jgi:hypothetical protein
VVGAATVADVVGAHLQAFHREQQPVIKTVVHLRRPEGTTGSDNGAEMLLRGMGDVGGMSTPFTEDDYGYCGDANAPCLDREVQEITIGLDTVVFVVPDALHDLGVIDLTESQLSMLADGASWASVYPTLGLPDEPATFVILFEGSGTRVSVEEWTGVDFNELVNEPVVSDNFNNIVPELVADLDLSIGFCPGSQYPYEGVSKLTWEGLDTADAGYVLARDLFANIVGSLASGGVVGNAEAVQEYMCSLVQFAANFDEERLGYGRISSELAECQLELLRCP